MKKLIILGALGLIAPLMSMGQSTFGPGTITTSITQAGSPHNFSDQSWNPYVDAGRGGQICQPCHTPHNALAAIIPLWNHDISAAAGYSMYTKEGATTSLQGLTAPDGTSLLCLSCHDGSVALGSFGGLTGATFIGAGYTWTTSGLPANSGALFGKDLTNDHPISITMGTSASRPLSGYTSTFTSIGVYGATTKMLSTWLDNASTPGVGKVQCTSCHGPHSNGTGYQLKQSNQGSAICISCHKK